MYLYITTLWLIYFSCGLAFNIENVTDSLDNPYNNTEVNYGRTVATTFSDGYVLDVPQHIPRGTHEYTDYVLNLDYLSGLTKAHEIIYPVQYRKNKPLPLDTRDYSNKYKNHYHHTTIVVMAFGNKMKLRLDLNRELLSKGTHQKYHVDKNTKIITESSLEQCYYQGKVRKITDSMVALSTCYGISGIIKVHNESYTITPLKVTKAGNETRHPHVIYKNDINISSNYASNRGMWEQLQVLHKGEFLRRLKIMRTQQVDRDFLSEKKSLELALVMDNTIYERFNNSYSQTLNYAALLANILDIYFQELRTRVNLVLIEIWNMDSQFSVNQNIKETLHSLLNHLEGGHSAAPKTYPHYHIAQFVTNNEFAEEKHNLAIPESICSSRAIGVNTAGDSLLHSAYRVAKSIAINIGINITNDDNCKCKDSTKCFIDPSFTSEETFTKNSYFSWCNVRDFNITILSGLGACLFNPPFDNSYNQNCGNGEVERGEECDCGYKEECLSRDACCDYNLCLLKPWSTCRHGECCDNCTIMSSKHICRAAITECDVPEYCTGEHGQCPENEFIRDGTSCKEGEGYCYKGLCPNHQDQCYGLWGEDSVSSDDKCYVEFNPSGSFNGHCGRQSPNSNIFVPCQLEDVKCGLLHCSQGRKEPNVNTEKTFSRTTVVSEGKQYQCKIVNGRNIIPDQPDLGLVEEGTKCGPDMMCLNHSCVSVSNLQLVQCPTMNDTICLNRGVCTSGGRCICNRPYYGTTCEHERELTITTADPDSVNKMMGNINMVVEKSKEVISDAITSLKGLNVYNHVTTEPSTLHTDPVKKSGPLVSTLWLMIVLAGVAGGTLLILLFCMCCYRRRSPKRKMKKTKSKMILSKVLNTSIKSSSCEEIGSRIISFGNMPSYRKDKIKKAMRKSAVGSESGSEHSHGRESTLTQQNAIPLTKTPERGILKKWPRSSDSLDYSESNSDGQKQLNSNIQSPEELPFLLSPGIGADVVVTPGDSNRLNSSRPLSASSSRHNPLGDQPGTSDHSCSSCSSSCSCSSCESDCKHSDNSADEEGVVFQDEENGSFAGMNQAGLMPVCVCNQCNQYEVMASSGPGVSCMRHNPSLPLENINELIRQIDESVQRIKQKQAESKEDEDNKMPSPSNITLQEYGYKYNPKLYGNLSINIPEGAELPPYSSPPPPIKDYRVKPTSSPETSSSNTQGMYPMYGISPIYRTLEEPETPHSPPSYDSLLSGISPASTLQCSPRRIDSLDSCTVPYRGVQQLSPTSHHRNQHEQRGPTSSGSDSPQSSNYRPVTSTSPTATSSVHSSLEGFSHNNSSPGQACASNKLQLSDSFGPVLDRNSISEGYHSDKHETEESIIVREIPRLKSPPDNGKVSTDFIFRPKSAVDV